MSVPERYRIDADLVRRLVDDQFPQWARRPLTPMPGGAHNAAFRLGDDLLVRLPRASWDLAEAEKLATWLPRLAPRLPVPIPAPVARGEPGAGYPAPWSVYRWLPGETAEASPPRDLAGFAGELGGFLAALYAVDPAGGPPPGRHSFQRGADIAVYDAQAREAVEVLGARIDGAAALAVLDAARAAPWDGQAVWVHGDVAPANLLLADGRLAGVIDFGCCAVGDPACDLAIAYTLLDGPSRAVFAAAAGRDEACWARGRAWALWKALITLARDDAPEVEAARCRRAYGEVVEEARG